MAQKSPYNEITTGTRVPPQALEAEKALLGSIMLRPDAIFEIGETVTPESFYASKHKIIYEVMLWLHNKKEPIDLLSLSSRMEDQKKLDLVGGRSYLTELVSAVPSSTNVKHYAEIIQKKHILRELINASDFIGELGFNEDREIEDLMDQCEKKIFEITNNTSSKKTFITLKDTLAEAWDRLDKLHKGEKGMRGIPSGYKALDDLLSGFQKSDLVILAARPSMGKSTLALDIARKAACEHNIPVGIFSLEMGSQQLVDRMLAAQSRVNAWKLRTGQLSNDEDFSRIRTALDTLSQAPIYIDDQSSLTILQIRSIARKMKREHDLQLIIIDYLQLITPTKNYEMMVHQVSEVSRSLKGLARELDIPVIALSQLSRAIEHRRDKPRLSDLRDSGSIEQDADVVMFIHRDDKYRDDEEKTNITEIHIEKHRNGPTGKIELYFDEKRATFISLEKDVGIQSEGEESRGEEF
ncbi:MAG: replicative DNA helicase [Candidatus Paceibacterota bacterium]